MRHLMNLRTVVASVALTGMMLLGSSSGSAGDYCHAPRYYYKTVSVYESVRRPYEHTLIRYDHCGDPYAVTVVSWKTVQVPVAMRVRVQY